ncbi:endoribonuclease Arlr-like isoform X2 [Oratosquilla oratoria]|uniref:endoribonuclease Arlr-like isoform X2 n=1 Tax=Oratosquilla oratoria TaxID=337810 RepID=UPI003F76D4DE
MKILVLVLVHIAFGICPGGHMTDEKLKEISNVLFNLDVNNVFQDIELDYQGNKLFKEVKQTALEKPTFVSLVLLLDAYKTGNQPNLKNRQIAFLNAVMQTTIMDRTKTFLENNKKVYDLRAKLNRIWFEQYQRSKKNPYMSSGFQHTFVGELNNGTVGGLHNWVSFYKKEDNDNLTYKGYTKSKSLNSGGKNAAILDTVFSWKNITKSRGTVFIGTSPELELALYTICFYACPNLRCPVKIGGERFNIQTYKFKKTGLVGTAHPVI